MNTISIYSVVSGAFVRVVGAGNPDDLLMQIGSGEAGFLDVDRPQEFYLSDMRLVRLPEKPGPCYVFDHETKRWICDEKEAWRLVRERRNLLFMDADVGVNKAEDTGQDSSAWRQYRQALRDITTQPDPQAIEWPAPPKNKV